MVPDFASLVTSVKGTNPHMMIVDMEENLMSLMDLLKQNEQKKQVENDSEESSDSAKEEELPYDDRIIKGIIDRKPEYKEKVVLLATVSKAQSKLYFGELSQEDSESNTLKTVFQPCLLDNMILISSLDSSNSLLEIQVKKTVKEIENKNETKILNGRFMKAKAEFESSELNRADAWKVGFSYPLVACCNTERTG